MNVSLALPVITNITFEPSSEIYVGENLTLRVICNGSEVKAKIYSSSTTLPPITLTQVSPNTFETTLWSLTLEKGSYTVNLSCSDENNTTHNLTTFSVHELEGKITDVYPSKIFTNDLIKVNFEIKEDGALLECSESNFPEFHVYLDDEEVELEGLPVCNVNEGFILFFHAPSQEGNYKLKVVANYGRIELEDEEILNINKLLDFSIISLNTYEFTANKTITLKLKALERGELIEISKDNLEIELDDEKIEIKSITPFSDYYEIKFDVPEKNPGNYELEVFVRKGEQTLSDSTNVYYPIKIYGTFNPNSVVSATLRFLVNGVEKYKLLTDSNGYFNGRIKPGKYDIEITFSNAEILFYDVDAEDFSKGLTYTFHEDLNLNGLKISTLHFFEPNFEYEKVYLELKYDEGDFSNENLIKVFKCDGWNEAYKRCNSQWKELDFDLDTSKNLVKLELSSLSAFAIATQKSLNLDFALDKDSYWINESIKIYGTVRSGTNLIENATVTLKIANHQLTKFTDKNGYFEFELSFPQEGIYSFSLKAEKELFEKAEKKGSIEVKRKKSFSIEVSSIKIYQGQTLTLPIKIVNDGQSDLKDLKVEIEGLPTELYSFLPNQLEELKIGEEKVLNLTFSIPLNATPKTYTAKVKVSNEISKQEIFTVTILEKKQSTKLTGKIIEPIIPIDYLYLLIFAAFSFSTSFVLKKIKKKKSNEVRLQLFKVFGNLKQKEIERNESD